MEYPGEFSTEAEATVEHERILAEEEFSTAWDAVRYPDSKNLQHLIRRYIILITLAFAKEAAKLGRNRVWKVATVESEVRAFMEIVALEAGTQKMFYSDGQRLDHFALMDFHRHCILPSEMIEFKKFPEWKEYQQLLSEVARIQKKSPSGSHASEGSVATRLKSLRAEAGLTQEELAHRVKISVRTVKRHEGARTGIRDANIREYKQKLSEALGRDVEL